MVCSLAACGGGADVALGRRVLVRLAQAPAHAPARLEELLLESRELSRAVSDEVELAFYVSQCLAEELTLTLGVHILAAQLLADLSARLLGR